MESHANEKKNVPKLKDLICKFKLKAREQKSIDEEAANLPKLLNARKKVRLTIGYIEALSLRFFETKSA